jgi:acyl-CoA-dependent ceramide synthase
LNWETQQYKCWISQYITFGLLASLQAVNLFWLFLILRILANYIFTSETKDERSDDEEEDEEESQVETESKATLATGAQQENKAPQVMVNGEPVTEQRGPRTRSRKA